MADLGFWAIAADDPGHLALIEADGRETSAGDLLAAGNQVARGLQALGLQKGDVVAALLPNTRGMVELALNGLSERGVVSLDEERTAAMVSNLMVVLCGDQPPSPIVNAGSLYT